MPPIEAVTEVAKEPDDLRAMITAEYEKAVESDTGDSADAAPEVKSADAAVSVLPEPDAAATNSDRVRNSDGTFAKKTEAAPEKAAPVIETPSTDTTKPTQPAASTPAVGAPAGWTAAEKAEWTKLSPVTQAAVSRREQEMSKGGQQWSEEKRHYQSLLSPVAETARRRGLSVDQGLNALLSAQDRLDRDPEGAIRWLAQSYGVNIATLAGSTAEQGAQSQPDIGSLLQRHVATLLAPIQERFAAEDRQRQDSTTQLVSRFAQSPGHEHFESVEQELMAFIPLVRDTNPGWSHEKILQEAYDRAVYGNPTTRAALTAAREQDAESKRRTEAAQRATKARAVGSSVTGTPSGSPSTQKPDDIRALLEQGFAGSIN